MTERKWYAKDNGNTILWGEPQDVVKHHPTAIELPTPRPSMHHFWKPEIQEWYVPEHLRSLEANVS